MAVFTCPQCGHSQAVDDKHVGKNATCPKCKTQAVVASPSTPSGVAVHEVREHEFHEILTSRQPRQEYFAQRVPTLMLDWVVINDRRHPLRFSSACGVLPSFEGRRSVVDGTPAPGPDGRIDWGYEVQADLEVTSNGIHAYEIHFLLFDIWGLFKATLQAYEVLERKAKTHLRKDFRWASVSRRDMECHLASIAYVSRVRTKDGETLRADNDFIVREAQRYAEQFTAESLEWTPQETA